MRGHGVLSGAGITISQFLEIGIERKRNGFRRAFDGTLSGRELMSQDKVVCQFCRCTRCVLAVDVNIGNIHLTIGYVKNANTRNMRDHNELSCESHFETWVAGASQGAMSGVTSEWGRDCKLDVVVSKKVPEVQAHSDLFEIESPLGREVATDIVGAIATADTLRCSSDLGNNTILPRARLISRRLPGLWVDG